MAKARVTTLRGVFPRRLVGIEVAEKLLRFFIDAKFLYHIVALARGHIFCQAKGDE